MNGSGAGSASAAAAGCEEPERDCPLCPRLVAFRAENRKAAPGWHNAPVPSFGPREARLLVVGLAPGLRGANRTGRPFTGDHAGVLLYQTLLRFGLAEGCYGADPEDRLRLRNCRVSNAVRCVPPANLPQPSEVKACSGFLAREMDAMPNLRAVLALGVVSHNAVLKARDLPSSRMAFSHGVLHALPNGLTLADSYHVSRYNTNTGRLTEEMFQAVIESLLAHIG